MFSNTNARLLSGISVGSLMTRNILKREKPFPILNMALCLQQREWSSFYILFYFFKSQLVRRRMNWGCRGAKWASVPFFKIQDSVWHFDSEPLEIINNLSLKFFCHGILTFFPLRHLIFVIWCITQAQKTFKSILFSTLKLAKTI